VLAGRKIYGLHTRNCWKSALNKERGARSCCPERYSERNRRWRAAGDRQTWHLVVRRRRHRLRGGVGGRGAATSGLVGFGTATISAKSGARLALWGLGAEAAAAERACAAAWESVAAAAAAAGGGGGSTRVSQRINRVRGAEAP